MNNQLALIVPTHQEAREWVTGGCVDRSGIAAYTHLIRAPDDPERSPRSARKGQGAAWRALAKRTSEVFQVEIMAHMADGQPRTFNRICVEIWDQTADMSHKADDALWALVDAGRLEHTTRAPIMFRVRKVRP